MSNALAIATVTETLRSVLTPALNAALVSGSQITTFRPDNAALQGPSTPPGVNIFLYQATPNTASRNADLPTRKADGTLIRRPQAALDLHYLLSFYGNDGAYEQQRLLGAVVRAIHAVPVLQRSALQTTEATTQTPGGPLIFASRLSQQIDLVRFTPINFSLEEMSKLWSVFLKSDYVLSVAYVAGVVLIETDDTPPGDAPPALTPSLLVIPFSVASINAVQPQSVALAAAGPTQITLVGEGLGAENLVAFSTPGVTSPIMGTIAPGGTGASVTVTLPAGLHAGINSVQFSQSAPVVPLPGSSPHVLSQSNIAVFVILPTLVSVGPAATAGHLSATVSPTVGPQQEVSLILNQAPGAVPGIPKAFSLPADPHPAETGTLTFSTVFLGGQVPTGSYLARIRVDSSESHLTVSAAGAFSGPLVIVS